LRLSDLPTPLVRLDRLSEELSLDLWMKRDDCTGLALGGNKARKLEFILADARAKGHRTIVTTGPVSSNHTMMTAAAARRLGFDAHVVLGGARPEIPSGNLLLLEYLGATVHFSPIAYDDPTPEEVKRLSDLCRKVSGALGAYWIPGGGSMPEAVPGYMAAVAEIARQRGGAFDFDHVVVAYGTGSTTTGILLGLALGGFRARVDAVAVSKRSAIETVWRRPTSRELFVKASRALGLDELEDDVPPHDVAFGLADEGYGIPNRWSDQGIRTMATREGYLLDPVYTAKAFSGLVQLEADGRIARGRRVLFLHTGGLSMTGEAGKKY
jgi:1-aminocyclopropane-1-carboxylate deaminase/D-cysteine desulfhydrase-like pyridoxal-dependent ACC family enzyme